MRTGHQATRTGRTFSPGQLLAISEDVSRAGAAVQLGPEATEVVLLAIDPARAHAYWHIAVPDLNRARRETGRSYAPMVLRILRTRGCEPGLAENVPPRPARDAARMEEVVREQEVRLLQGSAYLDDLEPGGTYHVVLGLKKPRRDLALLATSAPVSLPPSEPSTRRETVAIDTRQKPGGAPIVTDLATEVTGAPVEAASLSLREHHAASHMGSPPGRAG